MESRLTTHRNLVKFSIVNLAYEIAARNKKILCVRKEICNKINQGCLCVGSTKRGKLLLEPPRIA
jgi:hypothetical protein